MKCVLIILLGSSCVLAQEKKVYHISTDPNPVAQLAASVQAEYKKFLEKSGAIENDKDKAQAEKTRAKL